MDWSVFFILIFAIAFCAAYIYFGYYQDYKRNPKEFTRSIIGMPLGMLARTFDLEALDEKLKDWANGKTPKEK